MARSFSYFGPTLPIFRFLDRDDEALANTVRLLTVVNFCLLPQGTISFEEFEAGKPKEANISTLGAPAGIAKIQRTSKA